MQSQNQIKIFTIDQGLNSSHPVNYLIPDEIIDVCSDGMNNLYMLMGNQIYLCDTSNMSISGGVKVNREDKLGQVKVYSNKLIVSGVQSVYILDPNNDFRTIQSQSFNHEIVQFVVSGDQIVICTQENVECRKLDQNFEMIQNKGFNFKGELQRMEIGDNKAILKGKYKDEDYQIQVNMNSLEGIEYNEQEIVDWTNFRF